MQVDPDGNVKSGWPNPGHETGQDIAFCPYNAHWHKLRSTVATEFFTAGKVELMEPPTGPPPPPQRGGAGGGVAMDGPPSYHEEAGL